MSENVEAEAILAMDAYVISDWFRVTLVTPTRFATVGLKTNTQQEVLGQLQARTKDPIAILEEKAPFGQPPKVAALCNLTEIEWFEDGKALTVRTRDSLADKPCKVKAELSDGDARLRVLKAIRQVTGELSETKENAGVWYMGLRQISLSAISLLFFVGVGLAGLSQKESTVDISEMKGGNARGLAAIYNFLGPAGMIAVGLTITAAMMAWWYIACKTPPIKRIARPVGDSG